MALPPSTETSELTFVVKKKVQWSYPGCLFLENRQENLKQMSLSLSSSSSNLKLFNNTHLEASETERGTRVKGKR